LCHRFSRAGEQGFGSWFRVAQSISRSTFDNALCALKPRCQLVGPCLVPTLGNRGEPPLVPCGFETEPPAAVFAGDLEVSAEWAPSPLWRDSAVGSALVLASAYRLRTSGRGPTINPASFGRGWGYQPHFPSLALRIDKGPITHPPPNLAISASRPELTSYGFADEVPKCGLFVTELKIIFWETYVFFGAQLSADRAFALCPDDQS
jgi:hypothetical protein